MFYLIMLDGTRLWLDADRDEWISDARKATRYKHIHKAILPAGGRFVGPTTEEELNAQFA